MSESVSDTMTETMTELDEDDLYGRYLTEVLNIEKRPQRNTRNRALSKEEYNLVYHFNKKYEKEQQKVEKEQLFYSQYLPENYIDEYLSKKAMYDVLIRTSKKVNVSFLNYIYKNKDYLNDMVNRPLSK